MSIQNEVENRLRHALFARANPRQFALTRLLRSCVRQIEIALASKEKRPLDIDLTPIFANTTPELANTVVSLLRQHLEELGQDATCTGASGPGWRKCGIEIRGPGQASTITRELVQLEDDGDPYLSAIQEKVCPMEDFDRAKERAIKRGNLLIALLSQGNMPYSLFLAIKEELQKPL